MRKQYSRFISAFIYVMPIIVITLTATITKSSAAPLSSSTSPAPRYLMEDKYKKVAAVNSDYVFDNIQLRTSYNKVYDYLLKTYDAKDIDANPIEEFLKENTTNYEIILFGRKYQQKLTSIYFEFDHKQRLFKVCYHPYIIRDDARKDLKSNNSILLSLFSAKYGTPQQVKNVNDVNYKEIGIYKTATWQTNEYDIYVALYNDEFNEANVGCVKDKLLGEEYYEYIKTIPKESDYVRIYKRAARF